MGQVLMIASICIGATWVVTEKTVIEPLEGEIERLHKRLDEKEAIVVDAKTTPEESQYNASTYKKTPPDRNDLATKKFRMWYAGTPGHSDIAGGGIGFAYSDDGKLWHKYENNPIIPNGTHKFNEFQSTSPHVVQIKKDEYKMLFLGRADLDSSSNFKVRKYEVGMAKSVDGLTWNIEPIKLDGGKIKDSLGPIIFKDGKFHMWYLGREDAKPPDFNVIFYANGESLESLKQANGGKYVLKSDSFFHGFSVIYHDDMFKMWFSEEIYVKKRKIEKKDKTWGWGQPFTDKLYTIRYAFSNDGVRWEKSNHSGYNDKLVDFEMNPVVITFNNNEDIYMYYTAADESFNYYPVRLATAKITASEIDWGRFKNTESISPAVLLPGNISSINRKYMNWDCMTLAACTIIVKEDK